MADNRGHGLTPWTIYTYTVVAAVSGVVEAQELVSVWIDRGEYSEEEISLTYAEALGDYTPMETDNYIAGVEANLARMGGQV